MSTWVKGGADRVAREQVAGRAATFWFASPEVVVQEKLSVADALYFLPETLQRFGDNQCMVLSSCGRGARGPAVGAVLSSEAMEL